MRIEEYFGKLCAARIYQSEYHQSISLVQPKKFLENGVKMLWDIGPSYMIVEFVPDGQPLQSGQAQIVHCYGFPPDNSDEFDQIDLHFLNTFYPAVPLDPPEPDENGEFLGWISPEGAYYKSIYGDHDTTARSIVATLENRILRGSRAREYLLKTWIQPRITEGRGWFVGRDRWHEGVGDLTAAQHRVILNIQEISGVNFSWELEYRDVIPD